MSLLLLDTNTLSYILKDLSPVSANLAESVRQGREFLLASVAHYELTRYLRLNRPAIARFRESGSGSSRPDGIKKRRTGVGAHLRVRPGGPNAPESTRADT